LVFKDNFNYYTEQYVIPTHEPDQCLDDKLDAFLSCYDGPSNLVVIYYGRPIHYPSKMHLLKNLGGHATTVGTSQGSDLHLFARQSPKPMLSDSPIRLQRSLTQVSAAESPTDTMSLSDMLFTPLPQVPNGQPYINFANIQKRLKKFESDILLIVDSCHAGKGFTEHSFMGRKCEMFCSIAETRSAYAPGHEASFTRILTKSLVDLIQDKPDGFSTSVLYRTVNRRQSPELEPLLFDQAPRDYGSIWLRRCQKSTHSPMRSERTEEVIESNFSIDVRFHFTESLDIVQLNKVVKSLQWLPFVQLVKLQSMHSPADDLNKFIRTVQLANHLRPLLARIRQRRQVQQAQRLRRHDSESSSSAVQRTTRNEFLGKVPRQVKLFDLSDARYIPPQTNTPQPVSPTLWGPNRFINAALRRYVKLSHFGELRFNQLCLSQRVRDGVLYFTLGVLAPTIFRWMIQGCPMPLIAQKALWLFRP
jgi:hypothetical protein